jgi:hypothetical protein
MKAMRISQYGDPSVRLLEERQATGKFNSDDLIGSDRAIFEGGFAPLRVNTGCVRNHGDCANLG